MVNKSLLDAVDRVKVVKVKGDGHGVWWGMQIVRGKKPYPKRIQTAERIFSILKNNAQFIINGEDIALSSEGVVNSVEEIVKLIHSNYRRRRKNN